VGHLYVPHLLFLTPLVPFALGRSVFLDEIAQWREILSESLKLALSSRDGPVEGARLQPLLKRVAENRGLSFPPQSEPDLRLHEFLSRFPDVVRVQRRPRQDLLVVPVDRADLLTAAVEFVSVRKDMFDAFTRVSPTHKAWYSREEDRVIWLAAAAVPKGPGLTAIPPVSAEAEKALRAAFAAQVENADVQARLLTALKDPTPFSSFSKAIHALYLQRSWHAYRAQRVIQAIQTWASENKVPWKEAWLVSSSEAQGGVSGQQGLAISPTRLAEAIASLDGDDLSRITIPLDIVAKLLRRQ
jgi:hypothetical protein